MHDVHCIDRPKEARLIHMSHMSKCKCCQCMWNARCSLWCTLTQHCTGKCLHTPQHKPATYWWHVVANCTAKNRVQKGASHSKSDEGMEMPQGRKLTSREAHQYHNFKQTAQLQSMQQQCADAAWCELYNHRQSDILVITSEHAISFAITAMAHAMAQAHIQQPHAP